jgi:hypothetical protein
MDRRSFFEKILETKEDLIITLYYDNNILNDQIMIDFEKRLFNYNTSELIKLLREDVQKTMNSFVQNIHKQIKAHPEKKDLLIDLLTYGRNDSALNPTGLKKYKVLYKLYIEPVVHTFLETKDYNQFEKSFLNLVAVDLTNDYIFKQFVKDRKISDILELIDLMSDPNNIDNLFEKLNTSYNELKKLNDY